MPKFSKDGLLHNSAEILTIIGKEAAENLAWFDLDGENREYEAQFTRPAA